MYSSVAVDRGWGYFTALASGTLLWTRPVGSVQ
jgi:hypothetical protein